MRQITKDFFKASKIEKNRDTIAVMDFLSSPNNVQKMIAASQIHTPALSAVVAELEEKFGDSEGFPLNYDAPDKNAQNRRNVGWMVRHVMREVGYTPVANSERTRIGSNSGAKFFGNASLYEKSIDKPSYMIANSSTLIGKNWAKDDMKMKQEDENYGEYKEKTQALCKKMKKMGITIEFLTSYLRRMGFDGLISMADMTAFRLGVAVPCIELYETIETILSQFEVFESLMDIRKDSAT